MKKFLATASVPAPGLIKSKFYWLMLVWIVLIAGLDLFASADNFPGGIKSYTHQSGSMKPAIKAGSLVITKPKEFYQKGEMITFEFPGSEEIVTHRIVNLTAQNEKNYYITKGDANPQVDSRLIPVENVYGAVVAVIPLLGWLIGFIESKLGLALLVVMPATLVVRAEFLKIKNELAKT